MTAVSQTQATAESSTRETTAEIRERSQRVLFQNYGRAPVAFVRGQGARLFDAEGREYLDFLAGIATSSLGHAHQGLVQAIREQAERYLHVSNLFEIPEQVRAAELLVAASRKCESLRGLDRAFFCNSGAEAVEALIKVARRRGHATGRYKIISTLGGFHGRTLGALAATGTPAYHEGFQPLPGGFEAVPFGDLEALERAVDAETAAVLIEPIQGEGGVIVGGRDYLQGVQQLCRESGALFLLDEVQTGIGRTGAWFGFQKYGVEPDAISLAKGLGGGVPVGAVLATEEVAEHLVPGTHGTTFGGNALATAAVCAVLEALHEGVLDNVRERSVELREALEGLAQDLPVTEVRGEGLLLAIELEEPLSAAKVAQRCLDGGLIVNAVRPHSIRMAPPLVLTSADVALGVERLRAAIEAEMAEIAEGGGDV